jgi:hypothetical protein
LTSGQFYHFTTSFDYLEKKIDAKNFTSNWAKYLN